MGFPSGSWWRRSQKQTPLDTVKYSRLGFGREKGPNLEGKQQQHCDFPIHLLNTAVSYEPEHRIYYPRSPSTIGKYNMSYLKAMAYFNSSGNHLI